MDGRLSWPGENPNQKPWIDVHAAAIVSQLRHHAPCSIFCYMQVNPNTLPRKHLIYFFAEKFRIFLLETSFYKGILLGNAHIKEESLILKAS